MTRRIVLSALSAVALLGCTLSDALAQARLRPIVQVEGDAVHLGDIIEGAGEAADIAVFGAPAPGASGMISAGRIIAAARDHGIFDLRTNGLTSVAVRRIGRTVGAEEIVQALRAAIVQQHRLPADIEIELSAGQMEATVEQAATGPVTIRSLSYNGASGRFEATYAVEGSRALEVAPARVVGNVTDIVRAPVLARPVLRGEVVTQADVALERRRRSELGPDIITDAAKLIGNAARRPMGKGSLVRDADIQRPEAVERNAVVLMTYEQPGMQLSMRGRALQSGAVGDTIQIQNISSRKTVEAVITGPNRAAVTGAVLSPQKTTLRGDIARP